jgi:predicted anti-sigma-YlaC factor YlaD
MFRRSDATNGDTENTVERSGHIWSPSQLIAVVIGIGAIVFGAIAISKTGLDLGDVTDPHRSAVGFHTTPLLALAEIAWGVLMLIAALRPIAGRALMALLGAAAIALGVVVVVDAWHHRLHDALGVHDRNGWLFIAAGVVTLLAALLSPVVATPGQRTVTRRHVVSS